MTSKIYRVLRGGGLDVVIDDTRSAFRIDDATGDRSYVSGFRLIIRENKL